MESHMRSAQVGQFEMQLRSEFLRKKFLSCSPTASQASIEAFSMLAYVWRKTRDPETCAA